MFKKRALALLSVLLFIGFFVFYYWQPFTTKHTIILTEMGFTPQNITINQGDSIVFKTNTGKEFWPASDLHPTHGIYPAFDPQEPIEAAKSWQFTFDKKGSWKYHNHLDPFFRGTIIVE